VKRALLFGALWLAATAATGAVAWGAVRLAGEQTAEQAVRPMTARQVEALAASSTTATAPTGGTLPASTTSPGGASTTTAAPAVAARQTPGGTVVVSLQGGRLSLVSATPVAGFAVEVEESGPDEVVVVFEGAEDDEVRVRAFVSSGEAEFSVESGGEQD
jgi:hypothetical protein